jgi:hypothetical protein
VRKAAFAAAALAAAGMGPAAPRSALALQAPPSAPALPAVPTPVAVRAPVPPARPIEAIPDAWRLPAAELPPVNPLFSAVDTPPRVALPMPVPPLETRTTLFVAVKLGENGRASDAVAVGPPLKALTAPLPALLPKWRFEPARVGGKPVANLRWNWRRPSSRPSS